MGTQMDIQRKDAGKKRLIRRIAIGVVLVAAVAGMSVVVSRLKPAAPSVDLSVVWRDTVKRGPMTREVRGLGTLVPIDTMLIPATTEGRGHIPPVDEDAGNGTNQRGGNQVRDHHPGNIFGRAVHAKRNRDLHREDRDEIPKDA